MRPHRLTALAVVALAIAVAACDSSTTGGTGIAATPAQTAAPTATVTPGAAAVPTATAPSSAAAATPAARGTFVPAGKVGASLETATLLADGRVLLAGGLECSGEVLCPETAMARLFDPATNTFAVVGPLGSPRSELATALLDDGSVLVIGGADEAAAEAFSPATLAFSRVAPLLANRRGLAAARLPGGRILVTGGWGGGRGNIQTFASAEVWDPATASFAATGSMTTARQEHSATALMDGRVLIVGGRGGSGDSLASAELYDPATGEFNATGSMAVARKAHAAVLLADGRVLVVGGESGIVGTPVVEIYDPKSGTFSRAGTMPVTLVGMSATPLPGGLVLIAGGRPAATEDESFESHAVAGAYLFDPATGVFSQTGAMTSAREGHTATLLGDGRVLIGGGWSKSGQVATAELYQP